MKKLIYLKKCAAGPLYSIITHNDYLLSVLTDYLRDDVDSCAQSWKQTILSKDSFGVSSNMSYVERVGNKVEVGCILDLQEGLDSDEYIFITTVDEICHILDQWDELRKQKPNYIIISREPEGVELTGFDKVPEEYMQYLQKHHRNT